jgi:curli biogenesis system outer membrane secretion channel CsgG
MTLAKINDFMRFFVIAALFMGLVGCATSKNVSSSPSGSTVQPAGSKPSQAPPVLSKYTGPKKRIAVLKFDAAGASAGPYGGWDIGVGLAAELTTALVNSGYFIVVERAELASVLREQEMGLQKIVSKETAAQVSRVLGAQLLIRGSITEFDQRAGGGGLRLGAGTGIFGGAVGGQTTEGIVGMDIRLIDTTSGQVIQSHRAEAKVSATGISADINIRQVTFGGDKFNKTVLGQATRQAIEQAVAFIIRAMESVPWTGRVVEVAGDQVYINAGATSGIRMGEVFGISAVVRELTDPSTGELLGIEEVMLGEIRIESVQEKFSVARMQVPFQTKRGDLVKIASGRSSTR